MTLEMESKKRMQGKNNNDFDFMIKIPVKNLVV